MHWIRDCLAAHVCCENSEYMNLYIFSRLDASRQMGDFLSFSHFFECRGWVAVDPGISDSGALEKSEDVLRTAWLLVYTVCIANGWFLLTIQQGYVENRSFDRNRRLFDAVMANGAFYATLSVLFAVLVVFLAVRCQQSAPAQSHRCKRASTRAHATRYTHALLFTHKMACVHILLAY